MNLKQPQLSKQPYLTDWLASNFIPMSSEKFEFFNFKYIVRFNITN